MKTKWLLYGALLVSCAGLGVPQWMRRLDREPADDGPVEMPAEPTSAELRTLGVTRRAAAEGPGPTSGEPGDADTPRVVSEAPTRLGDTVDLGGNAEPFQGLGGLGRSLERLDELDGKRSLADLDRLASLWVEETPAVAVSGAPAERTWAEVATAFPLRGILRAEDSGLALVGDHIVHVGDELLPNGELVLRAIEPRRLVLEFRGREVQLELPPFKARAAAGRFGAAGDSGSAIESPGPSEAASELDSLQAPEGEG